LASKTITVRVDADVKEQAEIILDEIGLSMTTLFNACLKALVREKKVPFALVGKEYDALNKELREETNAGSNDVVSLTAPSSYRA
jgi:addiction module RelB/DinJ family antitoxin